MQVPFRVRLRLRSRLRLRLRPQPKPQPKPKPKDPWALLIFTKKWHDLELIHIHQSFVG
jgi:hypothetical protein